MTDTSSAGRESGKRAGEASPVKRQQAKAQAEGERSRPKGGLPVPGQGRAGTKEALGKAALVALAGGGRRSEAAAVVGAAAASGPARGGSTGVDVGSRSGWAEEEDDIQL